MDQHSNEPSPWAAAQKFQRQLEETRLSLTPNQLKKQRQKLARLFHEAAASGEAPPLPPTYPKRQQQQRKRRRTSDAAVAAAPTGSVDVSVTAHVPGESSVGAAAPVAFAATAAAPPSLPHAPAPAAPRPVAGWPLHRLASVQAPQQQQHTAGDGDEEVGQQPLQLAAGWGGHADFSSVARLLLWAPAPAAATPPAAPEHTEPPPASQPSPPPQQQHPHQQQPQQQCRTNLSSELVLLSAANAAAAPPQQPPRPNPKSTKPPKRCYPHGNYPNYYGYRVGHGAHDPRLRALDAAWFQGSDVLDVGCNEGVISLALSQALGARSVLGVDVDARLIRKAGANMARARDALATEAAELKLYAGPDRGRRWQQHARRVKALARVSFQAGDWLVLPPPPRGRYDVVTCLSVSKWIHLNGGDAALLALFWRAHRALTPGGLFVLEPQPWRSYRAAMHKTAPAAAGGGGAGGGAAGGAGRHHSLEALKLRPDGFEALLTGEIGFELVARLQPVAEAAAAAVAVTDAGGGGEAAPAAAAATAAGAPIDAADAAEVAAAAGKGWDRPILVLRKRPAAAAAAAAVPVGGDAPAMAGAVQPEEERRRGRRKQRGKGQPQQAGNGGGGPSGSSGPSTLSSRLMLGEQQQHL